MLSSEVKDSAEAVRNLFESTLAAPYRGREAGKTLPAERQLRKFQASAATREKMLSQLFVCSCKSAPPLIFLYGGEPTLNQLNDHIESLDCWAINDGAVYGIEPSEQLEELVQDGQIAPQWAPMLLALNESRIRVRQLRVQYVECLLVLVAANCRKRVSLKEQLARQEHLRLSLNYRMLWLACIHLSTCTPLLSDLVYNVLPRSRRRLPLRWRDMSVTEAVDELAGKGPLCWDMAYSSFRSGTKAPVLTDDVHARWRDFEKRCQDLDDKGPRLSHELHYVSYMLIQSIREMETWLRHFNEILATLN